MSVPSTPENSSSYLLEASFWIQSLHSRVIACFTKLNNYTGMKSPYSGVTMTASEERFNSIAMQVSVSQKLGQFGFFKTTVLRINRNVQMTRSCLPSQETGTR